MTAATTTIPRDLHDLYKEAAEKWARGQNWIIPQPIGVEGAANVSECRSCGRHLIGSVGLIHASDCKAARILDLPREGV